MKTGKEHADQSVFALHDLAVNQKAKIAYLRAKDHKCLQTLMAMGVLPGIAITLIQKFPSYVFQIRHSQFAIDRELASAIYVRPGRQETSVHLR